MKQIYVLQVWDTLQAFCSSITGALATQAVLKGSGVGDETANIASATITWLLKGERFFVSIHSFVIADFKIYFRWNRDGGKNCVRLL